MDTPRSIEPPSAIDTEYSNTVHSTAWGGTNVNVTDAAKYDMRCAAAIQWLGNIQLTAVNNTSFQIDMHTQEAVLVEVKAQQKPKNLIDKLRIGAKALSKPYTYAK